MRKAARYGLLALPVVLSAAVVGLYLAIGAWLETAGGRAEIERVLGDRLGMPVHLRGDFDVMLWPAVGASGTQLLIGSEEPGGEIARSGEFEVAVALRPLIRGELQVESFSLDDGELYLGRLESQPPAGPVQETGGLHLPEIDSFSVRHFRIGGEPGGAGPWVVEAFEFHDFTPGRDTPLTLAVEGFGSFSGTFSWEPGPERIRVAGDWSDVLPERLAIETEASLGSGQGKLTAGYATAGMADALALAVSWRRAGDTWVLPALSLTAGTQRLEGSGCVQTVPDATIQLDLKTDSLDVPALLAALPQLPRGDEPGAAASPVDLRVRLQAGELLAAGNRAQNAELTWGGVPECTPAEATTSGGADDPRSAGPPSAGAR